MPENKVKIILEAANQTKQAFNEVESQGTKVFDNLKSHLLAFTAAGAAVTAFVSILKKSISEASAAEDIQNRLKFALESTGYSWKYAKASVDAFASSIQDVTRFSDEEARQALTNMMLYTRDLTKAEESARLAMDMSVRTGMDLTSSTRYIGMAMSGNVEMLGRYIPELRNLDDVLGKNATQAERAEYTFKILQQKFGGTAQADVTTYSGVLKQFQNQWSDFAETLGNVVLPALTKVLGVMTSILKSFNEQMNKGPLKQIEEEIEVIDRAIERIKQQAEKAFLIEENTGATTFVTEQEVLERVLMLEHERQDLLEKRQRLLATQRFNQAALAGEIKPDVLTGKAAKQDPFLALYGMTEDEFKDRMSYSKLMYEEWKEVYLAIEPAAEAVASALAAAAAEEVRMNPMFADDAYNLKRAADEAARNAAIEKERADAIERAETARAAEEGYAYETPTLKQMRDMDARSADLAKKMEFDWSSVANQIGSAFQSGFFDLFKGGIKDLKDVWNGFIENLVESFWRGISQMITNWILFQNVTGAYKSGSGLIGMVGSLLGKAEGGIIAGWRPIKSFQYGGIVDRPTLGMIGEGGGDEAVIPLKGGKVPVEMQGGGGTNVVVVYAMDSQSMEDVFNRSAAKIVQIVHEDIRTAGLLKDTIKGL